MLCKTPLSGARWYQARIVAILAVSFSLQACRGNRGSVPRVPNASHAAELPEQNDAAVQENLQPSPVAKTPTLAPVRAAPHDSVQPRLPRPPSCTDVVARIVSQNDNPDYSLVTLARKGEFPKLLRAGGTFGSRRVVGIVYDRGRMSPSVYLSNGRSVCQAMLFEAAQPSQRSASSKAARASKPAHSQLTEIQIDRSAVDSIFERLFELTRTVRIVPDVRDGKPFGVRLFGIGSESLLAALGVENGDRIERINGVPVTNIEAAMSLYANLRYSSHFEVSIDRRGQPHTIEISVI